MSSVVIEDAEASDYIDALAPRFPGVRFTGIRSVDEMLARLGELRDADVLMTKGGSMRAEIVGELPELRWVQSLIAGVDRFVRVLAPRPGIVLTSTRGMHASQMAEMALTQMLVLARGVQQTVLNKRRRSWDRWNPQILRGKCVAVVGLGISGQEIVRLCTALGMRVVGVSRTAGRRFGLDAVHDYRSLPQVAAEADFLILTVPYRPGTEGLINAAVLSAMKPTAFLVNIARGGIVDEDALVHALRAGQIAGAGLDVFRVEPLPADSALWELPNVFITPHMAGMSEHYVQLALEIITPNLDCYLSGDTEQMANRVDYLTEAAALRS